MTEPTQKDGIPELLSRLGLTGHHLQNVKLGPGVVGRNTSIVWTCLLVMLVGAGGAIYLKSPSLLGLAIGGALFLAVAGIGANVYFGSKNPAAAIMEGAQFLQYHQMTMAAKGVPVIEPSLPAFAPPLLGESATGEPPQEQR